MNAEQPANTGREENPSGDKPYLSPTQIEMITKCGEAYRRRYIEKHKIPPGIAAHSGSGFHAGAEANFRQKIETHRDLPLADIIDAAVAGFETATAGGFVLTPEEESRGASIVIGEAKDRVAVMAEAFADGVAPEYQPVAVEQTVRLELPGPRDLLGIVDLLDDLDRVTDFKTSGRPKKQDDVDNSVQLTAYAAAARVLTGRAPSEVRLDVLYGDATIKRQVLSSSRGKDDFVALANRINAINKTIDAGVFIPATPGAWWCNAKWCGYWSTCPYVNSQRAALAEQAEREQGHGKLAEDSYAAAALPENAKGPPPSVGGKAKRKASYKNPRSKLLAENPHCKWCGCIVTARTATLDHIVPLAHGGLNVESNYALACKPCNLKRGDSSLSPQDAVAAPVAPVNPEALVGGLSA